MRVIDLFCIVNILLKGQHYCTNPLHHGLKSGITAGSAGRWIWVESDETNHHHRFLIRRSSYFHNNKKLKNSDAACPRAATVVTLRALRPSQIMLSA